MNMAYASRFPEYNIYKCYKNRACFVVLVFFVVLHTTVRCQDWPCKSTTEVEFIGHKTDCRAYFICDSGTATKMYCPVGFAYHQQSLTCVPEDSGMEVNCMHRPTAYEHSYCKNESVEKLPDPKGCARYYDCGAEDSGPFDDLFLRECPYPKLWNSQQHRCVGPKYKGCGDRSVPIDKCEYLAHQCLTQTCTPCRSQFGSCKGLPDGLNAWPGREGSDWFIYCRHQRYVRKGRCKKQPGKRIIFDPIQKKCVLSLFPGIRQTLHPSKPTLSSIV